MPAELRAFAVSLRVNGSRMVVTETLKRELAKTAEPFAPNVRAAILNTPTHGEKHTGLRGRIAGCVQSWVEITGDRVSSGIQVNSSLMPDGEKSLPLMLEGTKPWRHPVYGDRDNWVPQDSHPYFYEAMALFGPASRNAVERAAQKIVQRVERTS